MRIIWLQTTGFSYPTLVFFSLHFQYFSELRKWLEPRNWLIPSQDSHVHTHRKAAEAQFNTITQCINKAVMVLGSPWLWLVHTPTLIQCQGCQAKSWLWGSLWQDSIIFGLNGATVFQPWPSNTASLPFSKSTSRLMPCGFALIDKSSHVPSTYLRQPVTETNPVSHNRYYLFALCSEIHGAFN